MPDEQPPVNHTQQGNDDQPVENGLALSGFDLAAARAAYQEALDRLANEFPDLRQSPRDTVELKDERSLWDIARDGILFMLNGLRIFWIILRGLWFIIRETAEDIQALFDSEAATLEAARRSAQAQQVQRLLLETLWARDYVQYALEQARTATYPVKRDTLQYLVETDDLLDELRRAAIDRAELDPVKLRKAQPTPPPAEAWWWYLDNRRTKRARRLNAFWFVVSIIPALAGIILITLLTQRLAVGGLDVLSGASAMAQVILGGGSILAGRELMEAFLVDRSSGRSWQGEVTFMLATIFLMVVALFYLAVPPAAAEVYNWFGQRAIQSGNAAEAELYLESATRLDPDPHAGNLVEVGCLYLSLGAPDRGQRVFERVLEADSRLLLARYHLAQIYTDQSDYEQALQLVSDGLNLLDNARADFEGDTQELFLPRVDGPVTADQVEYLLRLALGRAYLEANSYQQAKSNLARAAQLFQQLEAAQAVEPWRQGAIELPCVPGDQLAVFLDTTEVDLNYFQARTFDAICASEADDSAARSAWNFVLRSRASNNRQEAYKAEASTRLANFTSCQQLSENSPALQADD